MAEMDLETFLHNTQMRPNLTLTRMSYNDFFLESWSLQHRKYGLEMTFPSSAEVSA